MAGSAQGDRANHNAGSDYLDPSQTAAIGQYAVIQAVAPSLGVEVFPSMCAKIRRWHLVQCFPGGLYPFVALAAFWAIALNSLLVQALEVDRSETVPAAAAANSPAMKVSTSLVSEISKMSLSPVVKYKLKLSADALNQLSDSWLSVFRRGDQRFGELVCHPPTSD
jgi:hypothetical protein